ADADVDDIADALAGVPLPGAAAHALGEVGHAVEDLVDAGYDVFAVHDDALPAGGAQGDVEDGALLGDVDRLPAEHGVDPLAQAALLGQPHEEPERLVSDAVLGVVEVDADGLDRQALTAPGVVGEELPEVKPLGCLVVGLQRLPGRALTQQWCAHGRTFFL